MSIHETWEVSVNEHLCEPDTLALYADLRRRMTANEFAPILDVVTQRWRGVYDLYDAYAFGQIYAGLRAGELVLSPIFLGAVPSDDAQLKKNTAKLTKLPPPFKAILRNGSGDDDGDLSWTEAIFVGTDELAPQKVPLEIGYTRPLTTLWHLHHEHGLARWPYGHDHVWLLRKRDPCQN